MYVAIIIIIGYFPTYKCSQIVSEPFTLAEIFYNLEIRDLKNQKTHAMSDISHQVYVHAWVSGLW